jgi:hypothetical protein
MPFTLSELSESPSDTDTNAFEFMRYWKVEGNTLMANVGLTITSNCVPAGFVLRYKQKGEIYIANQIEMNL